MKNKIVSTAAWSVLFLAGCSNQIGMTEEASVSVYPEQATYQDHIVLTVEEDRYFDEETMEVTIDANDLGMEEAIVMDPEANQFSLAIDEDIAAAEQTIRVTLKEQSGETEEWEVPVEIVKSEEDEFDWEEARIYFVLTDRFKDGDPTNNDPNAMDYDTEHLETYHGGDFQGLIDQLDYLEDLGINTLWITPIVDNIDWNLRGQNGDNQYGYHGYWAKDFTQLDEHLGDIETFKRLINEAHDHGIKLMVDVVLNHSGYGMKETDTGTGIAGYPTQEEQSAFEKMLRLDPDPNHQVTGELSGLPDFITEEQAVRDQLIEWQADWIEKTRTERGDTIDFFRVDTVKHVENTTWIAFRNRLTEIQPDFKLIGEHYGGSIDETGGYLHSGMMDAILDFDFKNHAAQFVNWNIMGVQEELISRNEQLDNTATLGQFLSSHDEDGFLYRHAAGDEGKHMAAAALQITAKGQPVIYYGEEIGQSGPTAGDMNSGEYGKNRYDFDWKAIEGSGKVMHNHYRKLLNIRKDYSKIFSKGNRQTIGGSNDEGFLVFAREYDNESILVGLNTREETKTAAISVPFDVGTTVIDLYGNEEYVVNEDQEIELTIPGRHEGGTSILVEQK